MDKRALRKELFSRVRAMSAEARHAASAEIRRRLANDAEFQAAETVFAYLALPGEPDLAPLVAAFPRKRWAFSRVTAEDRLAFHRMTQTEEALAGAYGIHEPDAERHALLAAEDADLVLVPGVGFDPRTLARLGRGKGHYDRFLAGTSARLVGVAFSTQLAELAAEPHDVPMHRLLTEAGWI